MCAGVQTIAPNRIHLTSYQDKSARVCSHKAPNGDHIPRNLHLIKMAPICMTKLTVAISSQSVSMQLGCSGSTLTRPPHHGRQMLHLMTMMAGRLYGHVSRYTPGLPGMTDITAVQTQTGDVAFAMSATTTGTRVDMASQSNVISVVAMDIKRSTIRIIRKLARKGVPHHLKIIPRDKTCPFSTNSHHRFIISCLSF